MGISIILIIKLQISEMLNAENSNDRSTGEVIIKIAKTSLITPVLPMERIKIIYEAANVALQKVFRLLKKEDTDSANVNTKL
jgi:hypothetical protein